MYSKTNLHKWTTPHIWITFFRVPNNLPCNTILMILCSGDIREPTWCNGRTLAWNARDVGLSPALGTIFPIFITPTSIF